MDNLIYRPGDLKAKAKTFTEASQARMKYTVARIPGSPGLDGKKGSLRAIANRMRNELETQEYYRQEGIREFVKYLCGEGTLPELEDKTNGNIEVGGDQQPGDSDVLSSSESSGRLVD